MVKKLINLQCDVNIKDKCGMTALMFAVKSQNLEITSYLLKNGDANVNSIHNNGGTALSFAGERNDEKIILNLIECGVEFDARINRYWHREIQKLWYIKEMRKRAFLESTDFDEKRLKLFFQFLFSNLRLWITGQSV